MTSQASQAYNDLPAWFRNEVARWVFIANYLAITDPEAFAKAQEAYEKSESNECSANAKTDRLS